jgi:hypothetical protein
LSDGGEAGQLFDRQREALGIRDKYPASGLGLKKRFGSQDSGFWKK